MFKGPQGMSLAGNAAAAASAVAASAVAASAAATSAATAAAVAVVSCYCSIKIFKWSKSTDRFMKIDINRPQTTFRYLAENLV